MKRSLLFFVLLVSLVGMTSNPAHADDDEVSDLAAPAKKKNILERLGDAIFHPQVTDYHDSGSVETYVLGSSEETVEIRSRGQFHDNGNIFTEVGTAHVEGHESVTYFDEQGPVTHTRDTIYTAVGGSVDGHYAFSSGLSPDNPRSGEYMRKRQEHIDNMYTPTKVLEQEKAAREGPKVTKAKAERKVDKPVRQVTSKPARSASSKPKKK